MAQACGRLVGQDDHLVMSPFWRKAVPTPTLTASERDQLHRLEATVEAGVKVALAMIEAGKALATIRERQLFRDTSTSWETYVETRFQISKRRCDQMIAFAGLQTVLEEMGTAVPTLSERASRPLVGLAPDELKVVVAEASASPEGVTPASIRKAASKRRKAKAAKVPRPVRFRVPGAVIEVAFNAKAAAGGFNVEAALEAALQAARRQATEAA